MLGVDPESDIALLHVDATGLQPIAIADIEDVQPGDVVLAIGNPLGIGQSVSQGIVSAVVRKGARPIENFIQTDAAINPGNSGGALVDTAGRLVGINAVILSHSGGSEGIGFAIPVDLVQTVAASLKSHGRVARGWLGWAAAARRRAKVRSSSAVERNGPAHRAGIVPGDLVMRVGARPVHRVLDAANVVLGSDPGTHVAVEIVRRGVPATFDVELAPVPASQAAFLNRRPLRVRSAGRRRSTIASLHGRERELVADDRARVQIAVTLAVAQRIHVDPAACVAGEGVAAAGLVERVEAKLETIVRLLLRLCMAHGCLQR